MGIYMFESYGEMVTINDICEILNICSNSAYQLLRTNQIKAFRIGRIWKIPRVSVEEFVLSMHSSNKGVH